MANKKFVGGDFDDFLKEEGVLEQVTEAAMRKVKAFYLAQRKIKSVRGWVVLNHKKQPQISTFRKTKSSAEWNMRLELSPDEVDIVDWDTLFRRGFRAVRATLTVEMEA